jgi:endonuclease/exonuclease/phosphatase family metal-dependent hydrolase
MRLSVATYNIHKGVSHLRRRPKMPELRDHLRALDADVVFLQEVRGAQPETSKKHAPPGNIPQYEFLADTYWFTAYGKNAETRHGHHGNALLSRYPIVYQENEDISAHWLEQRGLLHCVVNAGKTMPRLHCLNVHLGLLEHWRRRQLTAMVARVEALIPPDEPLLIAGDFNDWHRKGHRYLCDALHATDVFATIQGKPARTFPSFLPLLPLDRIYVRGLDVRSARIHYAQRAPRVSDHAALSAELEIVPLRPSAHE